MTPESKSMMLIASSNISWAQDSDGHTLDCITGVPAQLSSGGTMLSCHSVYLYADQLIVLAEERAAELTRCEARELLDRPYKGMNLCGDTLNEQLDEQWPSSKKERPYYDAFCNEQGASTDVLRAGPGTFIVALLCVILQVLLLHMMLVSLLGWLIGRERWWAGPYLTGFLGFGDGNAMPSGLEIMLEKAGMHSVCKDLCARTPPSRSPSVLPILTSQPAPVPCPLAGTFATSRA